MSEKGSVLVVDDDPLMVRSLTDVLALNGWDVHQASSGDEAVAAVTRRSFDAILMDVRMQGMNGVTAFKAIRAIRPGANVFLMTAYAAHDLLAEARRDGVTSILSKPLDVHILLRLLTESIDPIRPVLVVDSDPAFLRTLSEVLALRGFPTATARSLDDAIRFLASEQPIAVLLHLHLGVVSPETAIAAVHDSGAAAALILYSGRPHGEDEIPSALPHEWVHAYLQKPFALDHMIDLLDAIGQR